jgi:hypothetical protein
MRRLPVTPMIPAGSVILLGFGRWRDRGRAVPKPDQPGRRGRCSGVRVRSAGTGPTTVLRAFGLAAGPVGHDPCSLVVPVRDLWRPAQRGRLVPSSWLGFPWMAGAAKMSRLCNITKILKARRRIYDLILNCTDCGHEIRVASSAAACKF